MITRTPHRTRPLRSSRRPLAALGAIALLAAVAGCSPAEPAGDTTTGVPGTEAAPPAQTTPAPTAAPTPSPSTTSSAALSQAELEAIFTSIQFVPGQYEASEDLVQSVYPGLTVSDESCLAPFGLGWDDKVGKADAAEFGTSNDRTMTAVVVSAEDTDVASGLVADAESALASCTDDTALFELNGTPVSMQLETAKPEITGADTAFGWQATGDAGGSPFTLIGITAQVGGTAIALVGWDPSTNISYVPQATQMFVDEF